MKLGGWRMKHILLLTVPSVKTVFYHVNKAKQRNHPDPVKPPPVVGVVWGTWFRCQRSEWDIKKLFKARRKHIEAFF